jgi:hypothetical protein
MNWEFESKDLPEERRRIFDNSDPPLPKNIGRYQITGRLGRGGMGFVLSAHDPNTDRDVALKIIIPSLVSDSTLARFKSEIRKLGQFRHPCIAAVYDAGSFEDSGGADLPFFVMELVKEPTPITKIVSDLNLPLSERVFLASQILDAVSTAHQRQVPHMDIAPTNVIVSTPSPTEPKQEIVPKLIDFGLAIDLTKGEKTVGIRTDHYVAPERLIDPDPDGYRSDVFSLGVLIYELVTLRSPFDLSANLAAPGKLPSMAGRGNRGGLTPQLDLVLKRALRTDPFQRFNDAIKFKEDWEKALRGELLSEGTEMQTLSNRARALYRVNRGAVWVGAVILLTLLGGTAVSAWQAKEAARQRDLAAHERDVAVEEEKKAARLKDVAEQYARAQHIAHQRLADVQDQLGWAIVGDLSNTNGLKERATQAASLAEEAYKLLSAESGPTDEDSLAALSDSIRFKQLAGDPEFLKAWLNFFSMTFEKSDTNLVDELVTSIRDTSKLIDAGDTNAAKLRVRSFLQPLLSEKRLRIRARMPWSLSQAAFELKRAAPLISFLPHLFPQFPSLRDLSSDEVMRTQPVIKDVASDLANEFLPPGHPDRAKVLEMTKQQ